VPKTPFVTGGEYAIQNFAAIEASRGMRFRGDLAVQIRDRSVAITSHRQLHEWILLPLVICAVGAQLLTGRWAEISGSPDDGAQDVRHR